MSRLPARWLTPLLVAGTLGLFAWWTAATWRHLASPEPRGDFRHFYRAAQAVDADGELYTPHRESYVYPPLFALLLVPLGRLEYRTAGALFYVLNVALTMGALLLMLREACRRWEIRLEGRLLAAATFLSLLLLSEQCRWEFVLGQSDTWILMAIVCGIVLLDRRPVLAGAVLGLAANIKYQTVLFLPYLLARGRFQASAGLVAAALLFAALPATVRGWERNAEDLRTALGGVTGSNERIHVNDVRWYLSVSVTSTLARAVAPEGGGAGRLVLAVGAAAGLVLLGVVVLYRRAGVPFLRKRPGEGVVLAEWMGVIAALLLFGTAVTKRHMFLLLPLMACSVLLLLRSHVRRRPLLMGVVVFSLGVRLPPNLRPGEGAARAWKEIGGPSWGLLVLFFTFLWVALRHAAPPEP